MFPESNSIVIYRSGLHKLLADVFSCAIMQKSATFTIHIIALEGEGTERVTTNLRGNEVRLGDGLSVVQLKTGDEIAA